MAAIVKGMLSALAPILPHLAEDAWQALPASYTEPHSSVFLSGWPEPDSAWSSLSQQDIATASALKTIRDHVNIVRVSLLRLAVCVEPVHIQITVLRRCELLRDKLLTRLENFARSLSCQERLTFTSIICESCA